MLDILNTVKLCTSQLLMLRVVFQIIISILNIVMKAITDQKSKSPIRVMASCFFLLDCVASFFGRRVTFFNFFFVVGVGVCANYRSVGQ